MTTVDGKWLRQVADGRWQNLDTLIELTSLIDSYALMTLLSS